MNTIRTKFRGTPLAAWFVMISAIATLLASLRPLLIKDLRDPNLSNVLITLGIQRRPYYYQATNSLYDSDMCAMMTAVGVILGIVIGCGMGCFNPRPVVSAVVGTMGGAVLGGLIGVQTGLSVNPMLTLAASAIMVGFSLLTRYHWRQSERAAMAASAVLVALLGANAAAAEPAPTAKPKVLILGDSISLGYTPVVKAKLADVADVSRPRENCQHSAYGLKMIDKWLGQEKWDVIHFNWGIWDTHMLDEAGALVRDEATAKGPLHLRHTPEQYRENLTTLVKRLKGTGAKLIWASTTPIMRYKGTRYDDLTTLNKIAAEIMKEHEVAIDDLYEFTLPNIAKLQSGDKVHFTAPGNEELGKKVSEEIRKALPAAKKS